MKNDIRCGGCNRKLAEGVYTVLNIKCTRCKTMNYLSVTNARTSEHRECQTQEHTREKTNSTQLRTVSN